jgi:hypothetical protein
VWKRRSILEIGSGTGHIQPESNTGAVGSVQNPAHIPFRDAEFQKKVWLIYFFRGALIENDWSDILNWTITVQLGRLGELWNGPHRLLKKFALTAKSTLTSARSCKQKLSPIHFESGLSIAQ